MTLVLIHGAGFTASVFEAQTAAFPQAHAPNLPGHLTAGSSDSIEDFAAFISAYVRDHAPDGAVLCGHSMGGAVALRVALDGDVFLRGIVLIGSGARMRVAPAILDGLARAFDETIARIAAMLFANPLPERVDAAVESMRRVGQAQTLRDYRACDAFDVIEQLGEVAVPLLALTGESDVMTPPKYAAALADRVPGAQARIVPGAGHMLMSECPAETNALLAAFLALVQA